MFDEQVEYFETFLKDPRFIVWIYHIDCYHRLKDGPVIYFDDEAHVFSVTSIIPFDLYAVDPADVVVTSRDISDFPLVEPAESSEAV